jgi:branched-subunit amino acid aminotransferase/4-amino-4-deoxychorismate lyase
MIGDVLINGQLSAGTIPVTDSSVVRGDGCFEVMKVYGGRPFGLEEHLDRLQRSAAALGIDLPPRHNVRDWIETTAAQHEGGLVRVMVTRGSSVPGVDEPSNVIVFGHLGPVIAPSARLLPVDAPWHAAGVDWDLAGAKILSYAPNLAASRRAHGEGFDDALLTSVEGVVLEGPTFSVAWLFQGVLETPTLELGILDSITRRVVLEEAERMGLEVVEDSWNLDRLAGASEVMALSTVREVQVVSEIGPLSFGAGSVTSRLAAAFQSIVG